MPQTAKAKPTCQAAPRPFFESPTPSIPFSAPNDDDDEDDKRCWPQYEQDLQVCNRIRVMGSGLSY
jgi:hypothetical protein